MIYRESKRFLLISIIPRGLSDAAALIQLQEAKSLIQSYEGILVDLIIQRREVHDKGSYIGEGKIQEASRLIKKKAIDVVVLNSAIKPGQIYEMKTEFQKNIRNIEVWDRVDLILNIFAKHADTKEASLQIELAAMRHMGPRIYGMGMELSRQRGGIGARGIGETNTELMKRHWHVRMRAVRDRLGKLANGKRQQLTHRRRIGMKTASIVGYTNAGKTSIFNVLTKKDKLIKDALFVTLDSAVGKMFLPISQKEILVSDTIGFIGNLPTQLIDAFKSTLMESIYADVLIHVIDISDIDMHSKISTVENILLELGLKDKKRIYVFNKIDMVDKIDKKNLADLYSGNSLYYTSVRKGLGISELVKGIEKIAISTPEVSSRQDHI